MSSTKPSKRGAAHRKASPLRLITADESAAFRAQGFLLVRSALTPSEVQMLLAEVERLVVQSKDLGTALHEPYYHENSYKLLRALRLSSAFDFLIDHPSYFGTLVSLIGSHLQLMGTEVFVRGAAERAITGFHTDLGAGLQQMLPDDENPFLQIKAQIFLTDLSQPDSSNFVLIPGSHRWRVKSSNPLCMIDDLNRDMESRGVLPERALQVLAQPGDVLLFTHSLWHAVAPNRSGRTRFSIAFRYGQLALRPLERFDPILAEQGRVLTARQRRLLGDLGHDAPSVYRPHAQDEIIAGAHEPAMH